MTASAAIIRRDNVDAPAARERPGADTGRLVPMPPQSTTPEQRFWAKVDKNGPIPDYRPDLGPCWLWTASTHGGYGTFDQSRAHRFAYELLVGPIPEGLTLDHLCRNPPCVNPAHLEPVTVGENVRRGFGPTARNARKTHCKRGHALTPDNIYRRSNSPQSRGECLTCKREGEKRRWAKQKEAGVKRTVVAWVEVENPTARQFRQAASGMTMDEVLAELAAENKRGKVWALRGSPAGERYVFWCPADRPRTYDDFRVVPIYNIDRVPTDARCEDCDIDLHELARTMTGG